MCSRKNTWIGSTGLSNITAAPTATTVVQQVYIPVCLLTFSSQNAISHFPPWVNSRQRTEIISGFWLSARVENTFHLPSAPALTPTSFLLHSSLPFSHFTLIAPSPNLSGWFQACCVWPDLVSCDWNSNYDHLQIAFPPTEKSCCLSSALITPNPSMLTCLEGQPMFFWVEKPLTCN